MHRVLGAVGRIAGDQPEGIYAVADGTHYNQWCCFDYGNAQTNNLADERAIMETAYFGAKQWGGGTTQQWSTRS
nr:arabinofuranosidase catalytic domain-containing protein [Micromonospora jinlongensis]